MGFQWKREWTAPSVVGVISFGIGVGVGYAFSTYRKRIEQGLREQLEEVGTNVHFLQQRVEESGAKVLEAAWDIISNQEASRENHPSNHPSSQAVRIEESVFDDVKDHNWDYEEEEKTRDHEQGIYIVHRDEYFDEKDYSQTTLTYYMGDDVLVDELDVPIHNTPQIIGDGNLIFGKGSGDQSIVFIRNHMLDADYEIILDHGFYQVEVLGTEIGELLSASKPVVPKFRPE